MCVTENINLLGCNDAIWWHRIALAFAQVMPCCLRDQQFKLMNQCWLRINKVMWYSSENNFTVYALAVILFNEFENYNLKIFTTSPWGQCVEDWIHDSSNHYSDVIMSAVASQITGVSIVCSTVCPGAHQRKHQSSASLAFVRGINRWSVNSPHKLWNGQ